MSQATVTQTTSEIRKISCQMGSVGTFVKMVDGVITMIEISHPPYDGSYMLYLKSLVELEQLYATVGEVLKELSAQTSTGDSDED